MGGSFPGAHEKFVFQRVIVMTDVAVKFSTRSLSYIRLDVSSECTYEELCSGSS